MLLISTQGRWERTMAPRIQRWVCIQLYRICCTCDESFDVYLCLYIHTYICASNINTVQINNVWRLWNIVHYKKKGNYQQGVPLLWLWQSHHWGGNGGAEFWNDIICIVFIFIFFWLALFVNQYLITKSFDMCVVFHRDFYTFRGGWGVDQTCHATSHLDS